ncbi:MAG TPA: c-type cytochrome, partial [Rhizomicrobium sp.]|nr:c-type cytochrome [Rhizomicrobium sp.]
MFKKSILLAGAAAIAGIALGTVAFGPSAFGQGAAGPFTAVQVDAGRQAFGDNCAQCHLADLSGTNDAPQLAGSAFMGAWGKRTTGELYSKIHTTMPLGRGGSLDEATYANIVAYILRANGATPGSTAFTPTTAPVAIGAIANGQMPAGLNTARVAQTTGAAESRPADGQAALARRPTS